MRQYARLRGLRRLLLPVPVLTPRLSGLWLALVTPTQARVGRALVEGLKSATVVRSTTARETFGIEPTPLRDAFLKAIDEGSAARLKMDTRAVVVDGGTVEAYEPDRLLRLSADIKLPGRGWLEFEVTPVGAARSRIRQTATFDPRGLLGRAYWYLSLPLHAWMFRGMLARIARRAVDAAASHPSGLFTSVERLRMVR